MRSRVSLPKLALKLVLSVALPSLDIVETRDQSNESGKCTRIKNAPKQQPVVGQRQGQAAVQHQEKRVYIVLFELVTKR